MINYKVNKFTGLITGFFRGFNSDKYFKKILNYLMCEDILNIGCGRRDYKKFIHPSNNFVRADCRNLPNVDVVTNITDLSFNDNSFDFILCLNLLEHVWDTRKALSELRRVLRVNGKVLFHVPFFFPEHDAPYDFHRWTINGFSKLLEENNFRVLEWNKSNLLINKLLIGFSCLCEVMK